MPQEPERPAFWTAEIRSIRHFLSREEAEEWIASRPEPPGSYRLATIRPEFVEPDRSILDDLPIIFPCSE